MAEIAGNRDKRWSLEGATALVTGGTKGIRYPLVEELARFGATVHTCSRNEAELDKCLQSGRGWDSMSADLCVISSRAEQGKLDIILTKNLACEWAKDNIRTNCIAPGAVNQAYHC